MIALALDARVPDRDTAAAIAIDWIRRSFGVIHDSFDTAAEQLAAAWFDEYAPHHRSRRELLLFLLQYGMPMFTSPPPGREVVLLFPNTREACAHLQEDDPGLFTALSRKGEIFDPEDPFNQSFHRKMGDDPLAAFEALISYHAPEALSSRDHTAMTQDELLALLSQHVTPVLERRVASTKALSESLLARVTGQQH